MKTPNDNNMLIAISPEEFRSILKEELLKLQSAQPKPAAKDGWLTLDEACAYLRISKPTLYRLRREGRIQGKTVGRRVLFSEAELAAWVRGV